MALEYKESVKKLSEHYEIEEDVQRFLYMMSDNSSGKKAKKDEKNELVRALWDEGFEIHNPSGTEKIGSKLLQQCLWRMRRKLKFLDYELHCTGKDEAEEKVATDGIRTVMARGRLDQCFRDKCGVFHNLAMLGDGFVMMGKGESDQMPISFRVIPNENVYMDENCLGIRGNRPTNQLVVVYPFLKDEAYELWPDLKENGIFGRIPGTFRANETDVTREQDEILEVAWCFNLARRKHMIIAGTQAHVIDRFEGEEYPWEKHGEAFLPVFQFMFEGNPNSPYNCGIGDFVYDLAVITAKLLNMEVGHVEENVHPITLLNLNKNQADELILKMAEAYKARSAGYKPFVAMDFGVDGSGQAAQAQSLLTNNLANEWQILWDRLVNELTRMGINVNDADRGNGITATQIYSEEDTKNDFATYIQEGNASETNELLDCIIEGIKEMVSIKNKTPLNLRTRIKLPDGATTALNIETTMGQLAKELKDNNYFFEVNARTGATKSDLYKLTNLQLQYQMTPPGSPEAAEIYRRISQIRGVDIELSSPTGSPGGAEAQIEPPPGTPQRVTPEKLSSIMDQPVF